MGGSGNPEGAPGAISKGGPPAAPCCTTDTLLPLEKHSAPVDTTSKEPEHNSSSLEAQICMEFEKSVGLGMKKGLQKSSTFPTSAAEEAEQGVDSSSSCDADEVMKDAPAYERSMSLPPTLKPISALKGSRQKNGLATENRRVTWAPDVYDPPVTSVCHSVNSSYHYQRRSKPRRKEKNKQKKKQKAKSKKSHHNSSVQNSSAMQAPTDLRLETSDAESSLKDLGNHEAVILDYSIGKEAKCGSSFLRESVSKMHFSIGEAS